MKTITLPSMMALIVLLATACGTPSPVPTQLPAAPAATDTLVATEPPVQPAATDAPVTGNSTRVEIRLADNTIESTLTEFQVGVPYTFVITNQGRRAHNFNINPPVSVVGSLNAALDNALLVVKQEQLGAGASVTVEYTFPESAAGQLLEFSCLIRKHYEDKMFLPITVAK